jgi:spermidine synthase
MEAVYPGSQIDVVEIDPGVTQIAYDALGLSPDTEIASYNQDARMFLERQPDQQYDLIMGDAFNDFSVPYHLTTLEFNERVHAWLSPNGMYIVNIIDGGRGHFLRAYVRTMRQTFKHVYLAPTIDDWQTSVRSTFVIIGTDQPLDQELLQSIDAGDGYAQLADQLVSQTSLNDLIAEGQPVLLTDRYAPVDQMLAAVFLDRAPTQ